jgi:hypothetical protein
VVILVLVPLNLLVGFLIIRRVLGNIVGPLIIVWSGTVAFWSVRAEIQPVLLAIFDGYNTVFGWLAFFLMIAHFPNGEIYPARMAPWIYRLLGIFLLLPLGTFLSIETLDVPSQMANPFYLPALDKVAGPITGLGIMGFSSIMVLALVPPVLRFRNGSPRERQQIKWLALFGAAIILYTIPAVIIYPLLTGGQTMDPGNDLVAMLFYLLCGLFPPLVIGIAIFRHHLWDIDILIRRTLVYSILTLIVTLIYFSSVVVLQRCPR